MMSHWKNVDKACQRERDYAVCHVKKNEREKDDSIWHVAKKNTIAIGMSKKNERQIDDSKRDAPKIRAPNRR